MVVGADIAELLMKNQKDRYRVSPAPSNSSCGFEEITPSSEGNSSSIANNKEEMVTNKFREFLLYGSEKEALGMLLVFM